MKIAEDIKGVILTVTGQAKDWDLDERDRYMAEHEGEDPDVPVEVIVEADE